MAVSPNTENYLYGKGSVLFKKSGESGYYHLGNCPAFSLNVELEKAEHYSSMAGTKEKDLSKILQKSVKSSITMEEFSAQNMNLVLLGGTPTEATQEASTLSSVSVSVVMDQFVQIQSGALRLSSVTVTDGADTTYEEGDDYILNRESGMIMALSTGSISGTCSVSATVAALTTTTINALSESSCEGELYFVGNPDVGPNWQVKDGTWNSVCLVNCRSSPTISPRLPSKRNFRQTTTIIPTPRSLKRPWWSSRA